MTILQNGEWRLNYDLVKLLERQEPRNVSALTGDNPSRAS